MYLLLYDQNIAKLYQSQQGPSYAAIDHLLEQNYQQLLKLIPHLPNIKYHQVARSKNKVPPLYLFIKEKYPFTATITLTHQFKQQKNTLNRPDLSIKVYFDAQIAHATASCEKKIPNHNHPYLNNCSDKQLKWELNLFLKHWLDYCLDQDYRWQS